MSSSGDPQGSGFVAAEVQASCGPQREVVISVCVTCRAAGADASSPARPGEDLLARLEAALPVSGPGPVLRPVQCLSVCSRPCTAALSGPGRYTYVFGDLDPARDAAALLDCAATYTANEHGYLLWRERPESLRRGIVARIPPTAWRPADGRHPR